MTLKNLLKSFPSYVLSAGASLTIGLLSFSGMLALSPSLALAYLAFVLAVIYEGEIFRQNISNAFKKLFIPNYYKQLISNQFLLDHFPKENLQKHGQFFIDYNKQLVLLNQFDEHDVSPEKKAIEKRLKRMEAWFARILFSRDQKNASPYAKEVLTWINNVDPTKEHFKTHMRRLWLFRVGGLLALSATGFMTLGTSYLLVQALFTVPWFASLSFAAWPLVIFPLSVIAGIAYGLLTYNAFTDMIHNRTLQQWSNNFISRIKTIFSRDSSITLTKRLKGIGIFFLELSILAAVITLTICTAGTWWTIAKNMRPLLTGLSAKAGMVLGSIQAAILGIATLSFNIENVTHSIENIKKSLIEKITKFREKKGNLIKKLKYAFGFENTNHEGQKSHENLLQQLNPIRFITSISLLPLRWPFFMGHLVSIGVMSDQIPGVPKTVSAGLGALNEYLEDFTYFSFEDDCHVMDPDKKEVIEGKRPIMDSNSNKVLDELRHDRLSTRGHQHNHSEDIPTVLLKGATFLLKNVLFLPLHGVAGFLDCIFSQFNTDAKNRLSLSEAFRKQWQNHSFHWHHHQHDKKAEPSEPAIINDEQTLPAPLANEPPAIKISKNWIAEEALLEVSELVDRLSTQGGAKAINKKKELEGCRSAILNEVNSAREHDSPNLNTIVTIVKNTKNKPEITIPRSTLSLHFFKKDAAQACSKNLKKTNITTVNRLEDLESRIQREIPVF